MVTKGLGPETRLRAYMNDSTILREFWTTPDLESAQEMILHPPDGLSWEECTRRLIPEILTPSVLDCLPENPVAVEIGCGVGRIMKALVPYFDIIFGLDISPSMIRMANQQLLQEPTLAVLLCDGESFPLPSETADFVYSIICFQHIPTREMILRYLAESLRTLKSGGMIRVQTHVGEPCSQFDGYHGHFYRSLKEFSNEFAISGFEVIEAEQRDVYLWITGVKP